MSTSSFWNLLWMLHSDSSNTVPTCSLYYNITTTSDYLFKFIPSYLLECESQVTAVCVCHTEETRRNNKVHVHWLTAYSQWVNHTHSFINILSPTWLHLYGINFRLGVHAAFIYHSICKSVVRTIGTETLVNYNTVDQI